MVPGRTLPGFGTESFAFDLEIIQIDHTAFPLRRRSASPARPRRPTTGRPGNAGTPFLFTPSLGISYSGSCDAASRADPGTAAASARSVPIESRLAGRRSSTASDPSRLTRLRTSTSAVRFDEPQAATRIVKSPTTPLADLWRHILTRRRARRLESFENFGTGRACALSRARPRQSGAPLEALAAPTADRGPRPGGLASAPSPRGLSIL